VRVRIVLSIASYGHNLLDDGRAITLRDITEAHGRDQARELFLAVTSRELRTSVTVIKGYVDTLVDHRDGTGRAEPPRGRRTARPARGRAGQ
jgi:signal transduction histidine kinase